MSQSNFVNQVGEAAAKAGPQLTKLKKACRDLEAVFLKDLLSVMRRSLPKSPFGDAPGAAIYEDMFDQAIAESAAKQGSFGIGHALYTKLAPSVVRDSAHIRTSNSKDDLNLRG